MRLLVTRSLALALVALTCQAPLLAQSGRSKTADLSVVAAVTNSCTLTVNPLPFGPYDPVGANKTTPLTQQATLNVQCGPSQFFSIELDNGQHASGTTRAMVGPANGRLTYELFGDSSYRTPFGVRASWTDLQGASTMTVYGRVPAGQNPQIGNYTDTVLVTVKY